MNYQTLPFNNIHILYFQNIVAEKIEIQLKGFKDNGRTCETLRR